MSARYVSLAFLLVFLVFHHHSGLISGEGNFTVSGSSYDCSSNLLCFGDAHQYSGNGTLAGRLSLINEKPRPYNRGLAFYKETVRMLDLQTRQSASFNTSFTIDTFMETYDLEDHSRDNRGDGMTFVMCSIADESSLGAAAWHLGIFQDNGNTTNKALVVEFDSFQNTGPPTYDISTNHVSLDLSTVAYAAAENASDVNITLWLPQTLYAWIEYSAATEQFEVRISLNNSRPIAPLLRHQLDLFDAVDEYMWVGFSAGNGEHYNLYYIGDWTFEAYGLPRSSGKRNNVTIVVAIAVAASCLLVAAALSFFVVRRRRQLAASRLGSPSYRRDPLSELSIMSDNYSYKQLSVATGAFSEESKLGQGGFGTVYRGVLPTSGLAVAVKKLSSDSSQGGREFIAEVSIISQLRHRNLIQLQGWCKDRGKYLLVYELMPNGSLDKALFSEYESSPVLSWARRFNIVRGTAAALDYLHQGWRQQVIHRDVKSSNIMLDDEWNAKLGDFGLARLVDHQRQAASTLVAGTYGYIAPEAAACGRFTDKTDVFALGAVFLEIACGRKALAANAPPDEILLVDWVWRCLSEGDVLRVVDRRLADYDKYWMEVLLLMGLICSHPNPVARPSSRLIVQVLDGDAPVPSVPLSKPSVVFKRDTRLITIEEVHSRSTSGPSTFTFTDSSVVSTSISSGQASNP